MGHEGRIRFRTFLKVSSESRPPDLLGQTDAAKSIVWAAEERVLVTTIAETLPTIRSHVLPATVPQSHVQTDKHGMSC